MFGQSSRGPAEELILVCDTCTPGWHIAAAEVDRYETAEDALDNNLRKEAGLVLTFRPLRTEVFF